MNVEGTKQAPLPKVDGSIGYWVQVTPGAGALGNCNCDAIMVDTDDATVTGKRGLIGTTDTATASPPLKKGVPYAFSYYSITAVSAGNVWALFRNNPL